MSQRQHGCVNIATHHHAHRRTSLSPSSSQSPPLSDCIIVLHRRLTCNFASSTSSPSYLASSPPSPPCSNSILSPCSLPRDETPSVDRWPNSAKENFSNERGGLLWHVRVNRGQSSARLKKGPARERAREVLRPEAAGRLWALVLVLSKILSNVRLLFSLCEPAAALRCSKKNP